VESGSHGPVSRGDSPCQGQRAEAPVCLHYHGETVNPQQFLLPEGRFDE